MVEPLNPADMQSLLTHDRRYQRAAAVLRGQWQLIMAEEDQPFRQQITRDDLVFARALLRNAVLPSTFEFESYAGVQQIRQHFGSQLSGTAQQWLVRKYV